MLRPCFIGPFTVLDKKGLAYMLDLPCKMQTYPVFYVSLLKPYLDPSLADDEALAPKGLALPQVEKPSREDPVVLQDAPPGHEDHVITHRRRVEIHRPLPALFDEQGDQKYHAEQILQRLRLDDQYQYLVQWRGYPE
uniref:Chromo domain-containing protein n=1 Tax=Peronospora matthiolae TaxID=2874970 RepID=A0AAV1UMX3_9STRA